MAQYLGSKQGAPLTLLGAICLPAVLSGCEWVFIWEGQKRGIMDLSPVSRTAILTLICRAVETERHRSDFDDPLAVLCLERLMSAASEEDQRWIAREKRIYEGFHERDAAAGVRRDRLFDSAANRFIADHPGCTVVNLHVDSIQGTGASNARNARTLSWTCQKSSN